MLLVSCIENYIYIIVSSLNSYIKIYFTLWFVGIFTFLAVGASLAFQAPLFLRSIMMRDPKMGLWPLLWRSDD